MKTAIVDTQKTGHHLEYIYGLCSELNNKTIEDEIDIFCDDYILEYIKENNLPEIGHGKNLDLKLGILKQPTGNWFHITTTAYHNIKILSEYDRIIFLTLNIYFAALLIYGFFSNPSFSVSGIFFNPKVREKNDKKNWIRNFTIKNLLRFYDCRIFILNDKIAVDLLNRKYSTDTFEVLPDPIPEFYYRDIDINNKNSDSITFTMIGSISRRKGVFEFLKAIEVSNSEHYFLIAGKVQDDIIEEVEKKVNHLQKKGIKIELRNRFLTNREFAQTIVDTDVIVIPYLTKGASSGILGHAAFMKKIIIGPNEGLISELIEQYNLGFTIDPKYTDRFIQLLSKGKKKMSSKAHQSMERYAEKKSIKQFTDSFRL